MSPIRGGGGGVRGFDFGIRAGTAYFLVNTGEETTCPTTYDWYVCNPTLDNLSGLEAHLPTETLKLFDAIGQIIPNFAGDYWEGIRNCCEESDFWHSALPIDPSNRITDPVYTNYWPVKPSAALGADLGAYFANSTDAYFDGAMLDNAFAAVPNSLWTLITGAADYEGESRSYWDSQMYLFTQAIIGTMKSIWGATKGLTANSAGALWAQADGIQIEGGWIDVYGEAWALSQFAGQKALWQLSSNRYPGAGQVLSSTWLVTGQERYADVNYYNLVYRGYHV